LKALPPSLFAKNPQFEWCMPEASPEAVFGLVRAVSV